MSAPLLIVRYAGDDWKGANAFRFTLYAPAIPATVPPTPGLPVDLTGYVPSGLFFFAGGTTPLPLTVANNRATLIDPPTLGQFELSVESEVTAGLAPQSPKSVSTQQYFNRLQIRLTDPAGDLITLAVNPILVLAPGTVYP